MHCFNISVREDPAPTNITCRGGRPISVQLSKQPPQSTGSSPFRHHNFTQHMQFVF